MSTATARAYQPYFAGRFVSFETRKIPQNKAFYGHWGTYSGKVHCIKDSVLLDESRGSGGFLIRKKKANNDQDENMGDKQGDRHMKVFYFTATGNCLSVAKKIGGEAISIPQAIRENISSYKDDAIGFVFPVFDGTYPRIMKEFLDSKKLDAEYFFVVATYGFFSGNTLYAFQKLAAEHGIKLDYSAELLMVDNYLPLFDVEKEIAKLPSKKVEENLGRISADIASRKRELTRNTVIKSIGTFFERPMLKKTNSGLAACDFSVNDDCIKCGTCAKVCPAGNISIQDCVTFDNRCYNCLTCVHACPKTAIHVNGEKSGKRWRNPDVKLKELIEANKQQEV